MKTPRFILSSAFGAIITIAFVVVITIWAEYSAPLKDWLKNFSGHHWTSKSIFSMVVYVVTTLGLYLSPFAYNDNRLKGMLRLLVISTVLGVILLTLFFTVHYLD